jgi:hypothetical protein
MLIVSNRDIDMLKIQVFKSQDMIQEEESRRLVMKEHIQVFTKNTLDGLTQELKITTSESRYYVLLAPQFGQKVSVSGINTPQFLHDVLITTTSRMTSFSWVAACSARALS